MASVLDVACGGKMFYFDKNDERVVFSDIRSEVVEFSPGRTLIVAPDVRSDFTALPYRDETFSVVVYDPPHLKRPGNKSYMARKYGKLNKGWKDDIAKGFEEAFRVVVKGGVVIFKWSETDIPIRTILSLIPHKPVLGQRTSKAATTHWVIFTKGVS